MPKRKPKVVEQVPNERKPLYFKDLLPEDDECRCWYCKGLIAVDAMPVDSRSYIRLLSGDFAHTDCQNKTCQKHYGKSKQSLNAWLRAQEKRHMKYAEFHKPKVTVR